MITLALALLAAAQAPEQAPRMDNTPTPWPDPEREQGGAISKADPEARQTLARYAACIAARSPDKVTDLLTQDFRETSYGNGLRNLVRANEGCARQVGTRGERLRGQNLPFAAALAEAMMAREATPLKVRLAKAASGKEAATFAPSDKVAMCVARSTPDEVAGLFATEVGSDSEKQVADKLLPVVNLCGQGAKVETSVAGLRSIIATASFRLLAAQES
ncbi:hypothetical protein EAO27_07820 [Sphingopyxis sp. YF1]|uniref:hypothetical protein n=1 Tax=Sphingopyxis sp. YF1 TaxID=2482763 RepID=UPI001F604AC8|nr:hypothetical protein [Sphingopyxis sp. YF1]UNU42625.1 hypothetical protein EAO27_07820 [Sphingopyxis sp. YF1]